ncbi:MAG TPA: hypothetical protein VFF14_05345, partial [Candidatus Deferrimicrobium sp.]|nr:hypothetical protein [Candidatus Deferrimicrobium sp.]
RSTPFLTRYQLTHSGQTLACKNSTYTKEIAYFPLSGVQAISNFPGVVYNNNIRLFAATAKVE